MTTKYITSDSFSRLWFVFDLGAIQIYLLTLLSIDLMEQQVQISGLQQGLSTG